MCAENAPWPSKKQVFKKNKQGGAGEGGERKKKKKKREGEGGKGGGGWKRRIYESKEKRVRRCTRLELHVVYVAHATRASLLDHARNARLESRKS